MRGGRVFLLLFSVTSAGVPSLALIYRCTTISALEHESAADGLRVVFAHVFTDGFIGLFK